MYPSEIVLPMKAELTNQNFEDLAQPADVTNFLSKKGTSLLVVNSVCGCAAGSARPAAIKAVTVAAKKPDNIGTVFAGFDIDAVNTARENMLPFAPSSPCMGLFKDGELVHMLERRHIEGFTADQIAENLTAAFDEYC